MISHMRPVSFAFSMVPPMMMIPGRIQLPQSFRPSVKWYGGAMLPHGNSTSTIMIPKLDGFM